MFKKVLLLGFLVMCPLAGQADMIEAEEAFKAHRYAEAFNKFLPDAEKGEYIAQYYIGYLYLYGLGVNKDEQRALDYIQKAADHDYDSAQSLLGYLYDEGRVVPMNKKKAISYYKKAANHGNTSALLNLGLAYYKGEGVIKDDRTAIEMSEKVPIEQQPLAGRYLGDIYLSNSTLPDRYPNAIRYYSSSAKNGDVGSYFALGKIYSTEESGVKNNEKAVEFYTYAASQGYVPAQYLLGIMYVNGENVERNLFLGHAWLELASIQKYEPATSALKELDTDMTLSETEASKAEFMRLQQEVLGKTESPFIVEERLAAEKAEEAKNTRTFHIRRRR